MTIEEAIQEIINSLLKLSSPTPKEVFRIKTRIAAKNKMDYIPSNAEIIQALSPDERQRLLPILKRKGTRTISGVTVIAVMTKPHKCPQDRPCAYCPGGPELGVPQSYTGFEPAAMRGIQNEFNPYLQVTSRINQLTAIGHRVDKAELIVMGGTFPSTPEEYQKWFIQRCLDALNGEDSEDLEDAKRRAETSKIRNVGITVETRPDWAKRTDIDRMLDMGVTRIELGVQNPDDQIYRTVGREHSVSEVIESTRIAKDAGLKIVYHLMPGMPGSNPKKDLDAFKKVFTEPNFKPDMIKIYPCLVIENTKAHEWYRKGIYKPYSTEEATNLIAEIKRIMPPWIRVMRVQRDIPARLILAGVKKSNLRQLVHQKLAGTGERCRCIRCREVGHRIREDKISPDPSQIEISALEYEASEGQELFISVEDFKNEILIGYLRLRIPSAKAHRPEIKTTPCAIIRELHVYGRLVPVGEHSSEAWQHKGYGSVLLAEAERIAKEKFNLKKLLVTSALGTKQYYRRLGYDYDGVYVSKSIRL